MPRYNLQDTLDGGAGGKDIYRLNGKVRCDDFRALSASGDEDLEC